MTSRVIPIAFIMVVAIVAVSTIVIAKLMDGKPSTPTPTPTPDPQDDPDCTPPKCAGGAGLALPPGAAEATAADCATYRKIVDAECADACLPDRIGICPRSIVVSSGGLDGGACKDLDYTQADGTTRRSAGPCGALNFNKWTKP